MNGSPAEGLEPFLRNLMWVLGSVWVVIQIVKSLKRSPPAEQEFSSKADASARQVRCDATHKKIDEDNLRRDKESTDSRSKLYGLIEKLRSDMDDGMRELGEKTASLETKTDMINQRQIQMDQKIDTLLRR